MERTTLKETIKRVVILGHCGFIGQKLTSYIRNIDPNNKLDGFSRKELDLSSVYQTEKLSKYFSPNTAVVMLSCIKPNIQDDLGACSKNITMVINICRVLEKHQVARFLYMSSAAVYGEDISNTNISETTPVNPRSFYGIAKYTSERLLGQTVGKGLVIFRPPAIYGPGEIALSYNPSGFLQTLKRKNSIELWGDGKEKREFIYVDDVVRLIYHFLFHSYDGVINIASGKSYSFRKSIDIIAQLLKKPITIRSKVRTKEKVDNIFDNTLLRRLAPRFKFTSLPYGLAKTYEYLYRM